jgi:hypothetical protein
MSRTKIAGAGESARWTGTKQSVKKVFNEFAATDASELDGVSWDELPEETLCSNDVYESFAYYMMHVRENGTDAKGKPKIGLDGSTAGNYLGIVINLAQDKFKANGSHEARQFFNCLDNKSSSPEALWLRKLKSNCTREHIERAKTTGEKLDKSASECTLGTRMPAAATAADHHHHHHHPHLQP